MCRKFFFALHVVASREVHHAHAIDPTSAANPAILLIAANIRSANAPFAKSKYAERSRDRETLASDRAEKIFRSMHQSYDASSQWSRVAVHAAINFQTEVSTRIEERGMNGLRGPARNRE